MSLRTIIQRINKYRVRYISERNFLVIASIIVGLVVGLVAVGLKRLVHVIHHALSELQGREGYGYLFYLLPLAGILLTVFFVQKLRKGKLGRGIANIIYSISRRHGNIPPDNTYSHVVSSAITVGFGGSVGLEAPIVVTGSALGSNIARVFLMGHKERIILLACGASAGIAAVFNTPVAGVLFSMEVLLAEFSIPTFIPVLISAATGAVVSRLLYDEHLFTLPTEGWRIDALPFYVLLGAVCGLVSVYFMRVHFWSESLFEKTRSYWTKAIIGGALLGLMIFLFPPLFGEGYTIINSLLTGDVSVLQHGSLFEKTSSPYVLLGIVLAIILVKIMATSATIWGGGNGGIFAPSLFTGALTGFGFAHFFNTTGWKELLTVNFIAAGMSGLLSGVLHAPMTAIFLIAEVTGGYTLFVPLMIVAAISYFICRAFEPYSIYTGKLARKGIRVDDRETVLLNTIRLTDIIDTDFLPLQRKQNFSAVAEAFTASNKNLFPVLNNRDELEGIVYIDDVKDKLMRQQDFRKLVVGDVMVKAVYKIGQGEDVQSAMKHFDTSGLWFLPVIATNRKFIGFADKRKLLDLLRETLSGHQLMT